MRPVRHFDDFLEEGVVRKQSPDISRANFLLAEARTNFRCLQEIKAKLKVTDSSANIIVKSCYDILMESIRARMHIDGYKTYGQGAHAAEVSYLRNLGMDERDVQFADQLRYFRNGILYYGTLMDSAYACNVLGFIERLYDDLLGDN